MSSTLPLLSPRPLSLSDHDFLVCSALKISLPTSSPTTHFPPHFFLLHTSADSILPFLPFPPLPHTFSSLPLTPLILILPLSRFLRLSHSPRSQFPCSFPLCHSPRPCSPSPAAVRDRRVRPACRAHGRCWPGRYDAISNGRGTAVRRIPSPPRQINGANDDGRAPAGHEISHVPLSLYVECAPVVYVTVYDRSAQTPTVFMNDSANAVQSVSTAPSVCRPWLWA